MNMQILVHIGLLYFVKKKNISFNSFCIEHIPEEKVNIFRVPANNSVMCGYFCIGFIDFVLAGKKLTDFMNLFSPYELFKK